MEWYTFDDGKSIGQRGSENGVTIDDLENIKGARIALEKDGDIAPYSVTLGIYGIMFHTHFSSSIVEAQTYFEFAKFKIDQILKKYDIPEAERNKDWHDKTNRLLDELIEYTSDGS